MSKPRPTAEFIRSLFLYDPDTGKFTRRIARGNQPAGITAGHIRTDGYNQINIDGRIYLGHILAWVYVTGEWPSSQIDHRNRAAGDDRWDNLRPATHAQNCQNSKARSKLPGAVKGVSWKADHKKWRARIKPTGQKAVHLGYFSTQSQAEQAYRAAEIKFFGEFARAA